MQKVSAKALRQVLHYMETAVANVDVIVSQKLLDQMDEVG